MKSGPRVHVPFQSLRASERAAGRPTRCRSRSRCRSVQGGTNTSVKCPHSAQRRFHSQLRPQPPEIISGRPVGRCSPGGGEEDVEQPVAEVSGGAMHERGMHPGVVERRVSESCLVEQVACAAPRGSSRRPARPRRGAERSGRHSRPVPSACRPAVLSRVSARGRGLRGSRSRTERRTAGRVGRAPGMNRSPRRPCASGRSCRARPPRSEPRTRRAVPAGPWQSTCRCASARARCGGSARAGRTGCPRARRARRGRSTRGPAPGMRPPVRLCQPPIATTSGKPSTASRACITSGAEMRL